MDTDRRAGPQLVLFPVPHFRVLGRSVVPVGSQSVNATVVKAAFWTRRLWGSRSGCCCLVSTSACVPRVARGAGLLTFGRTEFSQALLDPGEELLRLLGVIWCFGGVLIALSTRGRCEEREKRRAVASCGGLVGLHSSLALLVLWSCSWTFRP
ncbi:hypothetical protein Taro_036737 [Colocasia esculenta]|uniref:Uncharacterized protein n=1 Tax=Colocasia esculenta TaxID=4460 RepID=A0A843W7M9_COLES|nr:hypothetical protein [Colocasia esculenta]